MVVILHPTENLLFIKEYILELSHFLPFLRHFTFPSLLHLGGSM